MIIKEVKQVKNKVNVKVEGIENILFVVDLEEIETRRNFIDKVKEKVVDYYNEIDKKQAIEDKFINLDLKQLENQDIS